MNLQTKLDEMRKRCEAATPGNWRVEDYRESGDWRSTGLIWAHTEEQYYSPGKCVAQIDCRKMHAGSPEKEIAEFEANAAFIAAARSDLPLLISALQVCLGAIHEAKLWCDVGAVEKGEDYTLSERLDEALEKAEALLVGEEE